MQLALLKNKLQKKRAALDKISYKWQPFFERQMAY
jgi:hypothetical protein